jgi:adenine phosphoribosyltransferase
MHVDACATGARVLLVDDVLATGGTAAAAVSLIGTTGATLAGCAFLLAIEPLGGARRLAPHDVRVLLAP